MKIFATVWLAAYMAAWLAAFWLPLRKWTLSALAFIPAMVFSVGIPILVAGILRSTPHTFLVLWSALPFAIITARLVWETKQRNPNQRANRTPHGARLP